MTSMHDLMLEFLKRKRKSILSMHKSGATSLYISRKLTWSSPWGSYHPDPEDIDAIIKESKRE